MATPVIQPSFAAGELAPALHARVDLAKYHIGLATCVNWFIQAQGGAVTRAGTRYVDGAIDHARRSRLIPFQFNTEQTYALEFGHQKMRVIKDGAPVLEAPKTITGITQANPAVVMSAAHGYGNGDEVYVTGAEGMTQVNGRRFTVAGVTANTFQLAGVNSTGYGAYVSGGTTARYYTLATPYAEADLPRLKYVQSADTMTITHPGYAPRDLTRTGHAAWTLTAITFAATMAAPTGLLVGGSSVSTAETYEYVITAVDADTGEESLPSAVGSTTFKLEHDWDATAGDYINLKWTNVAGAGSYNIYKKRNGIFGFIGNAADGTLSPYGFQDNKIRADTSDTPPNARNPFNAAGDYPACVAYHDERRVFGSSTNRPQTIWLTGSGNYRNMNVSTPTKDDDAITRTLVSRQVNEVRHLVSMNVLIALTSGAEWKIWPGSQADVLTPAAFSTKPQSYAGCSHVPPILANDSLLFVQEQGSIVRDLRYQFSTDGYAGVDLSILAAHMFLGRRIDEWAFAQEPHKLIWAVRDDGVLLCFTYLKEQEIFAWSRCVTDGAVESVCTIREGNENVLYLIARRMIGGQVRRYVERMASRVVEDVADAWSVDSGLAYDGRNTDAARTLEVAGASWAMGDTVTLSAAGHAPFSAASVGRVYRLAAGDRAITVTVSAYGSAGSVSATLDRNCPAALQDVATAAWALLATTVSGLDHLEGRAVAVLGDGSVFPDAVVTSGAVTLEQACARIVVGLPYTCDLETLNIDAGQPTVQGRRKVIGTVTLRLEKSRGLQVGPDAGHLREIKERSTETYGAPIRLYTGDRDILIDPAWNSNGRIFIRQGYPLPASVLAVIPRATAGD